MNGDPETSRTTLGYGRRATTVLAVVLFCTSTARAQDVTGPSLTAAFIYNFAQFTEWPPDVLPPSATFRACVSGSDTIREALERLVKDRLLSGRAISVSQGQRGGPLRSCHLLYVAGETPPQTAALIADLRGAAVLTIGDAIDFSQQGGIAQLFVENGKMRFDLNHEAAKRARLQLSSKLLRLAGHVYEGPRVAE